MVGGSSNDAGQRYNVIFFSASHIATFAYPGARDTTFYGANNNNLVCGIYSDSMMDHRLTVSVRPSERD